MCLRALRAERRSSSWGSMRLTDSAVERSPSTVATYCPARRSLSVFGRERTDPRKVLFVDDGRRPLGLVYFRAALDASPDAAFQLESVHPEMAANQQLSNFAMVVLNDPGTLPPGFEDSLKRYVNGGGGLLISLGPSAVSALPESSGAG